MADSAAFCNLPGAFPAFFLIDLDSTVARIIKRITTIQEVKRVLVTGSGPILKRVSAVREIGCMFI